MKKLLLTLFAISTSTLLVACATTTTTVLNNPDGTYTLEASDKTEADALDGGIKKANELCGLQQKTAIVLSRKSKYAGGMDPNAKAALNTATSVLSATSNTYVPGQSTSKDYMVTIKYKCN